MFKQNSMGITLFILSIILICIIFFIIAFVHKMISCKRYSTMYIEILEDSITIKKGILESVCISKITRIDSTRNYIRSLDYIIENEI